jgi:transcriptional regulator with XRE-family HTH domain
MLDALRQQIRQRLAASGTSQQELAKAVGRTGAWLSMFMNGRREIRFEDIEKIAAYFGVVPAVLFTDPDLPPLRTGKDSRHASRTRPTSFHAARLEQLQQLVRQKDATIDQLQRAIDHVYSVVKAVNSALERYASTTRPTRANPLQPHGTSPDRPGGPRPQ